MMQAYAPPSYKPVPLYKCFDGRAHCFAEHFLRLRLKFVPPVRLRIGARERGLVSPSGGRDGFLGERRVWHRSSLYRFGN
jgi:hypothetical protein